MAKILIIDDDASIRELIRLSLETEGFQVIEAGSGEEGVELAVGQLPDLILCDIRMEQMDGYATLATLRNNTVTAMLPVILMTGQADPAGMRQGMELGADDYLPKPFKVDQLIGAVEARLRKQSALKEQAAKQLAALRANISLSLPHELLTPLNGIFGFADILAQDGKSLGAEEVASMATAIRASAERLHRLIQNFLLLAHLEINAEGSGQVLEGLPRENLRPAVEKVVNERAGREDRAADLELATSDVEALVRMDYWVKIVEEIVENAFKFSDRGAPVVVELGRREDMALLRVRDRGRGMRPEHIAEIGAYMQFERRFYEQQGSGLGLAIAKRLAEMHGGWLNVSSEAGRGTQVEVAIPVGVSEERGPGA